MREKITNYEGRVYIEFVSDSMRIFYGSLTIIYDETFFMKDFQFHNVSINPGQVHYLLNKYLSMGIQKIRKLDKVHVTESDNLQFEFL